MAKKDFDLLIIGGVVLIGAVIILTQLSVQHCAQEAGVNEIGCSIQNMFRGWQGGLTSGEEQAQAAMYAQY